MLSSLRRFLAASFSRLAAIACTTLWSLAALFLMMPFLPEKVGLKIDSLSLVVLYVAAGLLMAAMMIKDRRTS